MGVRGLIELHGQISAKRLTGRVNISASAAGGGGGPLQTKTITPSTEEQTVTPDAGYYGLASVLVKATTAIAEYDVTVTEQTKYGITTYIYQWGNLVLVYWDGAPSQTLSAETWYTIAEGLPASITGIIQPIYVSCFKWYEYTMQVGTGTDKLLKVYPRGGALTSQDKIRGELLYFTNEVG